MQIRRIAGTSLDVSQICLGTMTFGTPVGESEAIGIVHWALDHGINFIDTADVYEGYARQLGSPGGVAESIIGKALRGRHSQAVVATKVGNPVGPWPDDTGLGRTHILHECDKSLARLNIDCIGLYYMHRPDPDTPIVESVKAFADLIQAGKVQYWGLSNFDAEQTQKVLDTCDSHGWPRPVVHQPPYSLLNRGIEKDLLPLCRNERIAVVPYQILQGGLLTGKYRRGEPLPGNSRKAEKGEWLWDLTEEIFDQLEEIEVKSRDAGIDMTQYAIRWILSQPAVAAAIVGVKRVEQLEDAIAATAGGVNE